MIQPIDFIRPISSIAFAGTVWLAETITPDIPGVPTWVTALGFPIAMLIAVIYALIATHKALSESQAGRLADRDRIEAMLREDADKASESRERLIRATDTQTAEFKRLADNLSIRPCQKP